MAFGIESSVALVVVAGVTATATATAGEVEEGIAMVGGGVEVVVVATVVRSQEGHIVRVVGGSCM